MKQKITNNNELMFSTNEMWKNDKVPLQYALGLHTTNQYEAVELKQEILQALKLKELVEKSIMTIGEILKTSNDYGNEIIRPQLILLTDLLRQSKK